MAEYNISDCITAMSKYHSRYHHNALYGKSGSSHSHTFSFLLHSNILFCIGQYFADLLITKYDSRNTNGFINSFEGIEIITSNDIEDGVILAIKKYDKVFP